MLLRQNTPLTLHHHCYFEPQMLMMCILWCLRGVTHKNKDEHRYTQTGQHIQRPWISKPFSYSQVMWSFSHHTHTNSHSTLKFSDYRVPVTTRMSSQIKPVVRIMVTGARPMKLDWCSKAGRESADSPSSPIIILAPSLPQEQRGCIYKLLSCYVFNNHRLILTLSPFLFIHFPPSPYS